MIPDFPKPKERRDIEEFAARQFLAALPKEWAKDDYSTNSFLAEAVGKGVAATLKEFVDPRAIKEGEGDR